MLFVPEVVAAENAFEPAVEQQRVERLVERVAQRRVLGADEDHVVAVAHRLADRHEPGKAVAIEDHGRPVGQRGVELAGFHFAHGIGRAFVDDDVDRIGVVLFEIELGGRSLQDADLELAGLAGHARRGRPSFAGARRRGGRARRGHRYSRAACRPSARARGRQLVAVEHDVDAAGAQQRGEAVPGSLEEFGPDAKLAGEGCGQLGLEAGHRAGIVRLGEDIGPAPFGVGTPDERAALVNLGKRVAVGGADANRAEQQAENLRHSSGHPASDEQARDAPAHRPEGNDSLASRPRRDLVSRCGRDASRCGGRSRHRRWPARPAYCRRAGWWPVLRTSCRARARG